MIGCETAEVADLRPWALKVVFSVCPVCPVPSHRRG